MASIRIIDCFVPENLSHDGFKIPNCPALGCTCDFRLQNPGSAALKHISINDTLTIGTHAQVFAGTHDITQEVADMFKDEGWAEDV